MISIVTITYNNFVELKHTLESLRGVDNIEKIIIDGSCSEESWLGVGKDSDFYVSLPDRGISDAFNTGLRLVRGDYVLFLNSGDTLLDKYYLNYCQKIFEIQPEIDFIFSKAIIQVPGLGKILHSPKTPFKFLTSMPFGHQTMVMRKSLFKELGGFNLENEVCMDFDILMKLLKNGRQGYYYPFPAIQMDGGGISSKQRFKVLFEECRILLSLKLMNLFVFVKFNYFLLRLCVRKIVLITFSDTILRLFQKNKHYKKVFSRDI